jgi:hypothetical protein
MKLIFGLNLEMTQEKLFVVDGPIDTSYGQMYFASGDYVGYDCYNTAFTGQANGLCGGAVAGGLFLKIGVHSGLVPISVEVHETPPPVDQSWDEIVEASCSIVESPAYLCGWGGESWVEVPLAEGTYRTRFCAKAFGETDVDGFSVNLDSGECYLLILWPDTARPDEVVKQTSVWAKQRHEKTQGV